MPTKTKGPSAERRPTHPGAILRDDVLPELGITAKAMAEYLGVSRQGLHNLLSERSAMTPDMAVRVGKLCGNSPKLWLAMQQRLDLWVAQRDLADEISEIPTLGHAA